MSTLGVVSKTDAEEEMVRFPWKIRRYEFLADSPGAGKWRGAPGIAWEAVNEGADCVVNGSTCMGWRIGGKGQQNGQPTPLNKAYIVHGNETIDIAKAHGIRPLKAGDVIINQSGGGAGVGRPEERDPEAVRMDVKNELVSLKAARDIYKVILNPDTLEIDQTATRLARGK
jgi:N-methylhydantoinase B